MFLKKNYLAHFYLIKPIFSEDGSLIEAYNKAYLTCDSSPSPTYSNIQFIFYRKYLHINHSNSNFKNFATFKTTFLVNLFKFKKSFKKSLRAKLLQVNFFKKYLLIMRLPTFNLIFKKKFKNLKLFFNTLLKNTGVLFKNPFINELVFLENIFQYCTIGHVYFKKTESFSLYKEKKKSRLKRKITKKLVRKNYIEF